MADNAGCSENEAVPFLALALGKNGKALPLPVYVVGQNNEQHEYSKYPWVTELTGREDLLCDIATISP